MKVISGGQTGADRTGLEVARDLGIPTGGTVPHGWRTDAGPDPSLAAFGCVESRYSGYRIRTRFNVFSADGTVWFGHTDSPGCLCTAKACTDFQKPICYNPTAEELIAWIRQHAIQTLNVAGNRRRTNPAVVDQVRSILTPALEACRESAIDHLCKKLLDR